MKKITLYCDGSSLGNPGFGGWCAILRYKDTEKVLRGAESNTTNNQMELTAVIEGLKSLNEPCEVELISDSKYVCDGINVWLKGWISKNFRKVKNPHLWREYVAVSKPHNITAIWVKGHSGHFKNEVCDAIAREAASKLKNDKDGVREATLDFTRDSTESALDFSRDSMDFATDFSRDSINRMNNSAHDSTDSTQNSALDSATMPRSREMSLFDMPQSEDSADFVESMESQRENPTDKSHENPHIAALQRVIAYHFKDEKLLTTALTHRSYHRAANNERLEFLGDAVMDLLVGEYLFRKFPNRDEGVLTKLRASLVNEESLATLARGIRLGEFLLISNAEEKNQGRDKPSILSDAFEALMGAVYLDGGLEAARKISYDLLESTYQHINLETLFKDYKTSLQELTQSLYGAIPEYIVVDSSGPDHDKRFTIKLVINGIEYATECGKSKKEAEQNCAKEAISRIRRAQ